MSRFQIHTALVFPSVIVFVLAGLSFGVVDGECAGPRPAEGPIPSPVAEDAPLKGPDLERYFFSLWHEPYSNVLGRELLQSIWSEVKTVPEEDRTRAVGGWTNLGPLGMVNAGGGRYSGRILDIDVNDSIPIRLGAASGGLWSFWLIFPFPIGDDDFTSQAIGSFDTHPSDEDIMLVGTGEPWIRTGTGLWRTTDGGSNWTNIPMSPAVDSFYKLRFAPDGTTVHAATYRYGYYRSTNGGLNWSNTLGGNWAEMVTDFAISPANQNVIYATAWDYFEASGGLSDGLYRSTNGGASWTRLTSSGLPTSDIGRGSVFVSANGNTIYVAFAKHSDNSLLGVYKSTNGASTFSNVSPPTNYIGNQGWYDNIVTANPLLPTVVLVGGVSQWRSINGGSSWTETTGSHLHVDYHRYEWVPDGSRVYVTHDGGWSTSTDTGATWDSGANFTPVTQYVNFDVYPTDGQTIGGGSQDNGLSVTRNGGTNWYHELGGDGGGFAINYGNNQEMWATNGVYSGDWTFRRLKSTDAGNTWNFAADGDIDPSDQWYTRMRHDRWTDGLPYLFTNAGGFVYTSINKGSSWSKMNGTAFPATVRELTVGPYSGSSVVWACLDSLTSGGRLRVFDGGTLYTSRDSGLPTGVKIRKVAPHPTLRNEAYAIMNGLGNGGQKIYKTTNAGQNWTNISGNLPDVPMADLVVNPSDSNKIYLGTEFGCYRTIDGGGTWNRWNYGMPQAAIVTEMRSDNKDGEFAVLAATYGRGIWRRNITTDDLADLVFSDGFESGGTTAWTSSTP